MSCMTDLTHTKIIFNLKISLNKIIMEHKFYCSICNFKYKTQNGLLKHNKLNHQNCNNPKKYYCEHCNKQYNSRQSKWIHEQKCKLTKNMSLDDKIEEKIVNFLEKNPQKIINNNRNSNNNSNNNITNNIQLVITPSGKEDILKLPFDSYKEIMSKRLNCLTHIAEKLNFNTEIPENHSYCVTAINDKHASIINPETNSIMKTDKLTLFDQLLVSYLEKLDQIAKNTKFLKAERDEYTSTINKLRELLFQNKKYMKKYYSELNYISYNNKNLVQKTWTSMKSPQNNFVNNKDQNDQFNYFNQDEILEDSDTENSEDEEIKRKQEKLRKMYENKQKNKINLINIYESTDDSEDEEEIPDIVEIEIKIRNKPYIVKGANVYDKLTGELYGTYQNGKVKRKPKVQNDIEI